MSNRRRSARDRERRRTPCPNCGRLRTLTPKTTGQGEWIICCRACGAMWNADGTAIPDQPTAAEVIAAPGTPAAPVRRA